MHHRGFPGSSADKESACNAGDPGSSTGPEDLPNPGTEPRSPSLQVNSLSSEPPGKPKNTGVGSLSLPGDLSNPRVKLESPALKVDSLPAELPGNLTSTHGVPQALGLSPPLPLLR